MECGYRIERWTCQGFYNPRRFWSKSDKLFHDLGTDTTTAIRIFLTQAVANNGFPFEIKKVAANPYIAISEKEVLDRLAKSRDQSKNGEYSEAGDFVADMRTKYGI